MPLRLPFLLFLISCFVFSVKAQSAFIPYSADYYHLIDRIEIKSGRLSNTFHDAVKPFERKRVMEYLNKLDLDRLDFTEIDNFNLRYLKADSWEFDSIPKPNERPLLRHFFKQRADFYHYKGANFDIHVSPVVQFSFGKDKLESESINPYINMRGVQLRGSINQKLGFYTFFSENQRGSPFYVRDYSAETKGNPYSGLTKIIDEDSVKYARDYMEAEGYLVFYPSRDIMLRFGHSKNFIGSGVRSMILSDFSAPYFNFAANIKLGRLEYMNILAKMSNRQIDIGVANLEPIPPKFMVFHHINVNLTSFLNIGLFETVMFGNRKFDLNYLNPIIFYRFVEGLVGSSDNAIVGADFKLNLPRRISLYGQFVLDEFNSKENKKNGWYGQKDAGQLGFKVIDAFGLEQFDIQGEFNYSRPYTYSHYNSYSNTLNYNLPIAHPLGANFREFISIIRYQPINKLLIKGTWMEYLKGYDFEGKNWGGDISKNYREDVPNEFDNKIGQGLAKTTSLWRLETSYMFWHNAFVDLSVQSRGLRSDSDSQRKSFMFQLGIRWNAFNNDYLF